MAVTSAKEIFQKIPERFNAEAAAGLDAILQFEITGEGGGNWNVTIKDGTCQVQEGSHDAPTVSPTMETETWAAMVNKELNGMQAFMSGKLKLRGDMLLAQKIPDLFSL